MIPVCILRGRLLFQSARVGGCFNEWRGTKGLYNIRHITIEYPYRRKFTGNIHVDWMRVVCRCYHTFFFPPIVARHAEKKLFFNRSPEENYSTYSCIVYSFSPPSLFFSVLPRVNGPIVGTNIIHSDRIKSDRRKSKLQPQWRVVCVMMMDKSPLYAERQISFYGWPSSLLDYR